MTTNLPPQSAQVADWIRCDGCKHILFNRDFVRNAKVCPRCSHHHKLTAWERIELLVDPSTFVETNADLCSYNPLDFPEYDQKRVKSMTATELKDAVVTGSCSLGGSAVVMAVADFRLQPPEPANLRFRPSAPGRLHHPYALPGHPNHRA